VCIGDTLVGGKPSATAVSVVVVDVDSRNLSAPMFALSVVSASEFAVLGRADGLRCCDRFSVGLLFFGCAFCRFRFAAYAGVRSFTAVQHISVVKERMSDGEIKKYTHGKKACHSEKRSAYIFGQQSLDDCQLGGGIVNTALLLLLRLWSCHLHGAVREKQ
jgi:hypothetical protein